MNTYEKLEKSTEDYLKRLESYSFPWVANEIIKDLGDSKSAAQIAEYIKTEGEDSDVVKILKQVKSAKEAVLKKQMHDFIEAAWASNVLINPVSDDEVVEMATRDGVMGRDIKAWRDKQVVRILRQGPKTKAELQARLYMGEDQLDIMINKLVADKVVLKIGELYQLAESAGQTA